MAMKLKHFMATAFYMAAGLVSAASPSSEFDKTLQQKKYRLGPIKEVIVQDASAKSFAQDANCGHLAIDEKRVRFFLANAVFSSEYQYSQALQVGDCNAQATVKFQDGRAPKVSIDNWTGWGAITDRNSTHFLRCEACTDILEPGFAFDVRKRDTP